MGRREEIDLAAVLLSAILFLGVVSMYWTVVPGLVADWKDDPNVSHGFLVPVFSGILIYRERSHLRFLRQGKPYGIGLVALAIGAVLLIVGKAAGEYFTMRISLVIVLSGFFAVLFGSDGFRRCLFPLAFLICMVPIPYLLYDAIAFPLKMVASGIGERSLEFLNVPVLREGNMIFLPNINLEVADACSGIRSLMSLLTLAAATSYVLELGLAKGAILLLAGIPISVITNSVRIVMTGILSYRVGPKIAGGFFHEFSGWLIFVSGAVLVLVLARYLKHSTTHRRHADRPV